MRTCVLAIWGIRASANTTPRAWIFRLEVVVCTQLNSCYCWLSDSSSLWFSLFKPCLSNPPPELLTGPVQRPWKLHCSFPYHLLTCGAEPSGAETRQKKIQTAPSQHVSRATKEEIGLAHLKTMGLGFDFLVPAESYLCMCEHACTCTYNAYVISLCMCIKWMCISELWGEEHLRVKSRRKIAFSSS